jgi:integrase
MLRWSDVGVSAMGFQPSKTSESSGLKVKFSRTPEIERILGNVISFVEERNGRLIAEAAEQKARAAKGLKPRKVPAPVYSPYVLHRLDGKPFQQTGVRTAWRRAIELTDYKDSGYTIKDIRPKALTDADETMELKDVQKMAAHTSITTTEGYIRKRRVPTVTSPLVVPNKSERT